MAGIFRLVLTALALSSASFLNSPAAAAQPRHDVRVATVDAWLSAQFSADMPGITVIATQDGKPTFRKAYGMADLSNRRPLTPDAILRIGSLTKQFTAVGVLMLAEEGKLTLKDPITKFLPDYPAQGRQVMIEHLLSHTSGIPSYTRKSDFPGRRAENITLADVVNYFKDDKPEFEPGSQFRYSDSGYVLLGLIIEKASGVSYARFIEERITRPLGMTHTGYEGAHPDWIPVPGYRWRDGVPVPRVPLNMIWPYSAGALVSNVDDLARWQQGLVSGKLLRTANLEQAFTPYVLSDGKPGPYGYGWFVSQYRGEPMIHHDGDISGFASEEIWLPKERVYVAVLGNSLRREQPNLHKIARQIATAFASGPAPAFDTAHSSPASLEAFAGTYRADDGASLTVTHEGSRLAVAASGLGTAPLRIYKADGFLIGNGLMTAEFSRDGDGAVSGFSVVEDEQVTRYMRVGAKGQSAPAPQDERAALRETILGLDAKFFNAFNTCDFATWKSLLAEDIEFFQDNAPMTTSRKQLEASFAGRCGPERKAILRRELIAESVEVHPIQNYGAVQLGAHCFWIKENGDKEEHLTATPRFVHLWRNVDGKWQLTKVISYGH